MNIQAQKLVPNPRYSAADRKQFFDRTGPVDQRETVSLDKVQFAVDANRDGKISRQEWLQDVSDIKGDWKGDSPETELYLAKKPGFFGQLFGKEPKFNKASGWIEVPESGPVRYDTKVLNSIDAASNTAELATVYTIPYMREALYIPS